MSRHIDLESNVTDEQTALLPEEQGRQRQNCEELEHSSPKRIHFGTVVWIIIAIIVTILFAKGWRDGGSEVNFNLKKALKRALGGGLSGAAAMVLQVLLLMPLRTIMNYQYRFGSSFASAAGTLYDMGGLRRYYQGLVPALVQGPVARFGDTAANAGILALLQSNTYLKTLPLFVQTVFASFCAASFRMILTPVDTLKTTLQVQGDTALAVLRRRVTKHGLPTLWWGAFATAGATFAGHYPWFATYNSLSALIPEPPRNALAIWLLRLAFVGFAASVVSDCVSNSLRVVKTYRQVNDTRVSYIVAAKSVVEADGLAGLFGRGLPTRILCNGIQGILFSILWKLFLDILDHPDGNNPYSGEF